MNIIKDVFYKWGFLEFDIQNLVFKDSEEQLRKCYDVHVIVCNQGIYLKILGERLLTTLFVHPHCEFPTGLLDPRTKVVKKYYWDWKKIEQHLKKGISLPSPPITKLIDNKKFDEIIQNIVTDLSEYDESVAFIPYQHYHFYK